MSECSGNRITGGYALVLILYGVIMGGVSCRSTGRADNPAFRNPSRTHEAFEARVGNFPYTASDSRRTQILTEYQKVTVGMTKDDVKRFLGEPDVEEPSAAKISAGPTRGFLGWFLVYYLYKVSLGENLLKDQMVEIFINSENRVERVIPVNVEDAVE